MLSGILWQTGCKAIPADSHRHRRSTSNIVVFQ